MNHVRYQTRHSLSFSDGSWIGLGAMVADVGLQCGKPRPGCNRSRQATRTHSVIPGTCMGIRGELVQWQHTRLYDKQLGHLPSFWYILLVAVACLYTWFTFTVENRQTHQTMYCSTKNQYGLQTYRACSQCQYCSPLGRISLGSMCLSVHRNRLVRFPTHVQGRALPISMLIGHLAQATASGWIKVDHCCYF